MTIPADNWCSVCDEACHDHPTMCTVCGETLGPPPQRLSSSTRNNNSSRSTTGVHAVPEFLNEDIRLAGQELRSMLTDLSGQIRSLNDLARNALAAAPGGVNEAGWQTIPPELLDPQHQQQQGNSRSRATSKKVLGSIPRIILEDQSTLFRQATFSLFRTSDKKLLNFQAVAGEFGPTSDITILNADIVIANPRTGKRGLTEATKSEIKSKQTPIVYMERGDDITFVAKAIMAQEAGASAVIIGNNFSHPWPYVMKDSKNEATKLGLKISVVMVKQDDGKKIVEYCGKDIDSKGNFSVKTQPQDCVICRETFKASDSVVQLPSCCHVFHDECALAWLEKHNTCPYCRLELPTDDPEYEEERRRLRRTHAGGSSNESEADWNAFYG